MAGGRARSYLVEVALLVSLSLPVAPVARAHSVALDLSACPKPPATEVRALLALELRERLVPETHGEPSERASSGEHASGAASPETQSEAALSATSADTWNVHVRCDDRAAQLQVRETGAQRSVDLASVPEPLRARLLALSVAELATRLAQPTASEPVALAAEQEPSAAPNVRDQRRAWLAIGVGAELAPLLGVLGGLTFLLRVRGPLRFYAALELASSRGAVDTGRVRLRSVAVRLGPALALDRPRWGGFVGLGVRGAHQQYSGEPNDTGSESRSFSALSLGPMLFAGAHVALSTRWFLLAEGALTHQLRATRVYVRGAGARTLSPLAASLRLSAGVAW